MDYIVFKKVDETFSITSYKKKVNGKNFWKLSILKNILLGEVFENSLENKETSFIIFNKKSKIAHYFGNDFQKEIGYKYLKIKESL